MVSRATKVYITLPTDVGRWSESLEPKYLAGTPWRSALLWQKRVQWHGTDRWASLSRMLQPMGKHVNKTLTRGGYPACDAYHVVVRTLLLYACTPRGCLACIGSRNVAIDLAYQLTNSVFNPIDNDLQDHGCYLDSSCFQLGPPHLGSACALSL